MSEHCDPPVSSEDLTKMKFSEILNERDALKARGPIERGYSDKAFYNRRADINDEIDRRMPLQEDEI